jgi:hypothetical protein
MVLVYHYYGRHRVFLKHNFNPKFIVFGSRLDSTKEILLKTHAHSEAEES